nr:MAG TPA: hypothetical protein [Caudoviricetes sp.]
MFHFLRNDTHYPRHNHLKVITSVLYTKSFHFSSGI